MGFDAHIGVSIYFLCEDGIGTMRSIIPMPSFLKTVLLVYNHMYGGLADTEFPGSAPDGRLVLYDVKRQMTGTFLNIPLQGNTLHSALLSQLYERGRGVMMERTAAHNVSRR